MTITANILPDISQNYIITSNLKGLNSHTYVIRWYFLPYDTVLLRVTVMNNLQGRKRNEYHRDIHHGSNVLFQAFIQLLEFKHRVIAAVLTGRCLVLMAAVTRRKGTGHSYQRIQEEYNQ